MSWAAPGDLDPSFSGDGFVELPTPNVSTIAVDGGGNTDVAFSRGTLARYTPTGDLDASFAQDGLAQALGPSQALSVSDLAISSGGSVYASTSTTPPQGQTAASHLVKLRSDGLPDSTFGDDGAVTISEGTRLGAIHIDDEGRVLGGTSQGLIRFLPDGQLDPTLGGDGTLNDLPLELRRFALAKDGSGAIYVLGPPEYSEQGYSYRLVRLTDTGDQDTSFGEEGYVHIPSPFGTDSSALNLGVIGDGSVVVQTRGCHLTLGPSGGYYCTDSLARVSPSGALDEKALGGNFPTIGFGPSGALLTGTFAQPNDPLSPHRSRYPAATIVVSYQADASQGGALATQSVTRAYKGLAGLRVAQLAQAPDADIVALVGVSEGKPALMRLTGDSGPADADADGILDEGDACPWFASTASNGCPELPRAIFFFAKTRIKHTLKVGFEGGFSPCKVAEHLVLMKRVHGDFRQVDSADEAPYRSVVRFHHVRPGRYFALARSHLEPGIGICEEARTAAITVAPWADAP